MKRNCDECGREYETKRPQSRSCGATCRKRKSRRQQEQPSTTPATTVAPEVVEGPLVIATRDELQAAGKLETMLGQQAVRLAEEMSSSQTAAGMASLSKELRTIMAELKPRTQFTPGSGERVPAETDEVDDLRARRDAKLASVAG